MRSNLILFLLLTAFLAGCRKDPGRPPLVNEPPAANTKQISLEGEIARAGQLVRVDADENGWADLVFTTRLTGDPLNQLDKFSLLVYARPDAFLYIDHQGGSPVLEKNDRVPWKPAPGYDWYEVNEVELAVKQIPLTGPARWSGDWAGVHNKFLAFSLRRQGRFYQGWVELSIDSANGQILLHRAGTALKPDLDVQAGN